MAHGKAAAAAHAAHDARIASMLPVLIEKHDLACARCMSPACCYETVAASEDEAAHAAAVALAGGIDLSDRVAAWEVSARAADVDVPSPDPAIYFAAHIPCPLLGTDGRCAVYEARPLACRAHFVQGDPASCALPHADRPHARVIHVESRAAGVALLGESPTVNFACLLARYVRTLDPAARQDAEP